MLWCMFYFLFFFFNDTATTEIYTLSLHDALPILGRLTAPHGKFFVTGNHEYYWDAAGWIGEVERLGLAVLNHAYRVVERGAARLLFAGVPDLSVPSDPAVALRGAPEADVRVLLAHQPPS